MKALSITSAGHIELIEIDDTNALSAMQSAVGGFIEQLTLSETLSMVVDEEGKIKGRRLNEIATRLTLHYPVGLDPDDVIVGDVLLASEEPKALGDAIQLLRRLGYTITEEA